VSPTGGSVISGRSPIHKVWHIACSIRTTAILLATVTAISLLGTLFPQLPAETSLQAEARAEWVAAAQDRYGFLGQPLTLLGAFNVYSSPLFLAALAALLVSGSCCTIDRIRPVWGSITARPSPVRGDDFYRRAACHASVHITSRERARPLTTSLLCRHRYHLTSEERQEATYVVGRRFQWSRIGSLVTHSGLILMAAGALWGASFAWSEPAVILGPGQTYTVGHGHSFELRHDGFEIERYPGGQVKDYLSHVVVLKEGAEALSKTIRVNDPLLYEGVGFYLSSSGPSVHVLGWDSNGQPLPMQTSGASRPSTGEAALNFAPPVDEESLYLPSLETTLRLSLIEPLASGNAAETAFLLVEVWPLGAVEPSISTGVRSGEAVALSGSTLEFFDDYYSVFRVVSDPGFQPVIAASLIGLVGLLISFYFNPTQTWIKLTDDELLLVGSADHNRVAFERQFARLVAEFQSELP
jgi:cytochrome c biogenesis protein